jgi:competence protein ComEA
VADLVVGSAGAVDPPQTTGRDQAVVPAGWPARFVAGCKESVWAPVAVKALGIGVLMAALAGVGAASIATGATRGVQVPLANDIGSAWLRVTGPGSSAAKIVLSAAPVEAPSAAPAPSSKPSGLTPDGKVILNQATAEDLMHLPGIGRKRAEQILALRARLGRFKRPTDLLRVRGLGAKRLQRLLPQVVVDPPPEPKSGT